MYRNPKTDATPAIPTLYRGIQMRSRLEAKWAHVFDQLGWRWDYEPIDLNGWIPDFYIHTQTLPLLIDVKPTFVFDEQMAAKMQRALGTKLCTEFNAAIFGAGAHYLENDDVPSQCWFAELGNAPDDPAYGSIAFTDGYFTDIQGLICYYGAWDCLITGESGKAVGNHPYEEDWAPMWAKAANATQWRAPR